MNAVESSRRVLQRRLFPEGIPSLRCPTLTHFQSARVPDPERIRRHLRDLAPHVRGILVRGSTGEGWEMNDGDIRALLDIVLAAALEADLRVLLGMLKTETEAVLSCLVSMRDLLSHPGIVTTHQAAIVEHVEEAFHATFSVADHRSGRWALVLTPAAIGPRN